MNLFNDFLSLVYPDTCSACQSALQNQEFVLCTSCRYTLPYTRCHNQADNPVSRLFYGRVLISNGAACYLFQKAGPVQELIHQFKYKGRKEVGLEIGRLYGLDLKDAPGFDQAEVIIPVPLHLQKFKKRGFNQSELFANGLGGSMQLPVNTSALVRKMSTGTQTRRSRFNRWKNVESIFHLQQPEVVRGKHILLVDDVVTTGATLEACAKVLLEAEGVVVSVAAIAVAV